MATPEQLTQHSEHLELTVLPGLGARLHSLRVDGQELLRRPDDPAVHASDPFFWGAYVMAPWCNRVVTGPIRVAGRVVDLRPNFSDGSAIHGQVYASHWEQLDASSFAIDSDGHGWPWPYRTEISFWLGARSLTLALRLVNRADTPMPGGLGVHPWFVGAPAIAINSALVYPSNSEPPVEPVPVSGELDLRKPGAMAHGIDATWPDAHDPQVELWWPDQALRARWHVSTTTPHIVAANPPERAAMAVEPQTHAVQGLRRLIDGEPGAMALIEPGAALELTTRMDFDRPGW